MEKIRLKICCGTYCHIMGGAELLMIKEKIPQTILEHVDLNYSNCLDLCRKGLGAPPFVEINGEYMNAATVEKIVQEIKIIIESRGYGI